jgi:amidase
VNTRESLHYLTLAEVSGLIRRRSVSPVEVVTSQLARIRELDIALNAYVLVTEDLALAQARTAEAEILAGDYRGPLHGIPMAVKDLLSTKGVPTQGGLKILSGHVPDRDAAAVGRLKDAGAILVGKLHTAEGGMDGYHRDFKVPRNPWGEDRWPGVSSSGSGVAVAAGMCFASLGTDTGGSVRIPSAANGIVGLKPTRGVVSLEGVLPLAPSFDHVGPMARSVGDAAIVLEALAGLAEPPRGMEGVRIGFDERLCSEGVQPCVTEAVFQAVRVLQDRGASIVPASLPALEEVSGIWYTIAAAEAALAHRETYPSRGSEYGEGLRALLDRGRSVSPAAYAEAQKRRVGWTAHAARCFREFDVLAAPGLPGGAFRYDPEDSYRGPDIAAGHSDGIPTAYFDAMNRLMLPFNLNGYPALSLPCGMSPEGMPLSLQLVGRALSEPLLIMCGIAFEHETAWHLRHPPV